MKRILFVLLFISSLSGYAQEKIRVACVGNSVTYGYLLPDREYNAYPFQLQRLLGDKYEVRNFGKSGATLLSKGHRPYIEQEEYKQALDFAADIVIIHLGLNDTDPRNWPNYGDEFFIDYLNLINSFKKQNPKAKIWICRMSPITQKHPRFMSGTRDWYAEIQNEIERVASYTNVGLIDLQEDLYHRPDLLPDALHPTTEGAGIIAQSVYSGITGDYGGLKMPVIYSDNMVLQRGIPLKISGVANASDEIEVSINKQKVKTRTASNGRWEVMLQPLKSGGEHTLKIATAKNILTYNHVLIGEVWLCSGQSNMAFKLRDDANYNKDELIDNPNIRLFNMQARWETNAVEWNKNVLDSLNRLEYYKQSGWEECTNKSARDFSAIAYYFGKMLSDSLNVPIGLIHNAVGGSPMEAWIDRQTMEYDFPEILIQNWKNNDIVQGWVRERAVLNIRKSDNPEQRHPYEPSYLFESGIIPLNQYPIKGVIWYQGESNAHNIDAARKLFPLLVNSWRVNWNNPKLPFYYVQLSSLNRPSWASYRNEQRKLMSEIPNVYMAVSSDRGDSLDVHPRYKKDIGERLAFWTLNKEYHKTNVTPSGPLYKSVEYKDGKAFLSFDYGKGMHASTGKTIIGFEIAEVDGLYFPAQAEVEGEKIKLWSKEVKKPQYVRYGWQAFTRANVVNDTNLPMSTFKTEKKENNIMKNSIISLPSYPISGGISAPFTAIYADKLYTVGGCNFPNKPASEGGQKEFYSDIYALDITDTTNSKWIKVGNLPYPAAYGVTALVADGILCIGGENNNSPLANVSLIKIDPETQKITVQELSPLPTPLLNAGVTTIDDNIYVVGGSGNKSIYRLNINSLWNEWEIIDINQKEERQQPVVFSQRGELYMAGGYDEQAFTDILKFDFATHKWDYFDEIKNQNGITSTFVGTASANTNLENTLFVGGVNYERFTSALQRIKKTKKAVEDDDKKLILQLQAMGREYLSQAIDWYRFNTKLLSYNADKKEWTTLGNFQAIARAGAGVAYSDHKLYIVCGELKPGVRTDEVNCIEIHQ